MSIPIQFRKGTEAEWDLNDRVLMEGELGLVLTDDPDTQLMKIGDGVTAWSSLPWALRGPQGYDFEYQWTGTTLGVKNTNEDNFTEIPLGITFDWDGTSLGIKKESETEFSYVDIKGADFEYQWTGTTLGVKTSDEIDFTEVGLGLQYAWDGYTLGIKKEEDVEYTFADLRGANFEYTWDGTQLGVKTSDDEEFIYTNLKGTKGDTGNPGLLAENNIWVGNVSGVATATPTDVTIIKKITQAEYDALDPVVETTMYIIIAD